MIRQRRLSPDPIPELYIRWRDPDTNRVVRMERITPADAAEAMAAEGFIRVPRAAT